MRNVADVRRVATTDVTTRHAQAQVHPGAANAQTIFTTNGAGYDIFDLIEMSTFHNGKDSKPSLQILVLLQSEQSGVLKGPNRSQDRVRALLFLSFAEGQYPPKPAKILVILGW